MSGSRRGSVLAETVLVMPLLLLLVFGIIQFAQIWMARQMVVYAAACAARAMTVVLPEEQSDAADKAAKLALSWICLVETDAEKDAADSGTDGVQIPGWGLVSGSGSVNRRVRTIVMPSAKSKSGHCDGTVDAEPYVGVTVRFRFPLLIPGMAVNRIVGNFVNKTNQVQFTTADFYGNLATAAPTSTDVVQEDGNSIVDIDGWPYVDFSETCVLPMPYSPANYPRGGYDGCAIVGFEKKEAP